MRFLRLALVALAVPLVMGNKGGCAMFSEPGASSAVDTFCVNARKWRWSVNDTPETIRQAETWNRAIDKRCKVAS